MTDAAVNEAPAAQWFRQSPVAPRDENHYPAPPGAGAQERSSDSRGPVPSTAGPSKGSHWAEADIAGDILAVARRVGAAEPVEIRIRPEVHDRLLRQAPGPHDRPLTTIGGIPLVVDEDLPGFPGYEIHRAPPRPRAVEEQSAGRDLRADGADNARAA